MIKISSEEYHARPEVSNSALGYMKQSPAHYRAFKDGLLSTTSESLRFGSMVHAVILEPELFVKQYRVGPDAARNTKEWKAFAENNPDGKLIKPDEYNQLMRMQESVYKNRTAEWLLNDSQKEMSGFWKDALTDIDCRFRPDIIKATDDAVDLADLKTTTCAKPEEFYWSAKKYGYFRQAAFYMDGYEAVTGNTPGEFAFIAIEKEPPYICEVYLIDALSIRQGRQEYSDLLFKLEECQRINQWPGYSDGKAHYLERPEKS